MSNWHSLYSSLKDDWMKIVFHIAVPEEVNAVGKNLVDVMPYFKPITVSEVPYLGATHAEELAAIIAGTIYEYSEIIHYNAALTNPQKVILVDARYTELVTIKQNEIRACLKYYGKNQDVA